MREPRLLTVVSAAVFVDTMFYALVAPLLPQFAHAFHLSKLSAGVLAGSYALGTFLGSLPAGVLAARAGPRPTVALGLGLLIGSTIAFAFSPSVPVLDGARFVEGIGGACSWTGGVAWLVAETPAERRGAVIGRTLAAAIGGSLFGPVIGTVATVTGRPLPFCATALVAAGLLAQTWRLRPPALTAALRPARAGAMLRRPELLGGMWLVALPAIGSGVVNVLGPLRLHRLGAAAVAVGGTYLLAAAVEAVISEAMGRVSDRRGRMVPLRLGLAAAPAGLLVFTLPGTAAVEALVLVVIVAALGTFWAPAMAMLSDAAERLHLDQGMAAALNNLAWAGGQIIGSGGGGAVAKTAGDFLPAAFVAGLCAVTLTAVVARSVRRSAVP